MKVPLLCCLSNRRPARRTTLLADPPPHREHGLLTATLGRRGGAPTNQEAGQPAAERLHDIASEADLTLRRL